MPAGKKILEEGTKLGKEVLEYAGEKLSDLAMDTASRLKRAADQGFDTAQTWYHGTRSDFDEFEPSDIGVHLGSSEAADVRLTDTEAGRQGVSNYRTRGRDYGENARIIQARTAANNPLRMEDVGEWRDPVSVLQGISQSAAPPQIRRKANDLFNEAWDLRDQWGDFDEWYDSPEASEFMDEARSLLESNGYDSILYNNFIESKGKSADSLIVFDPAKIRSVNAAFDPAKAESSNLLASLGGAAVLGGTALTPDEAEAGIGSAAKNLGKLGKKRFWSGAYNKLDGTIEEVHPYETAEANDFHHSFYFSDQAQDKMRSDEWGFFWIDPKTGQLETEWRDSPPSEDILNRIRDQAGIETTNYPWANMPDMVAGGAILGAALTPEQAEAGPISKGGRTIIEAFHGSPHKFDKFDISKIGTGEGAQAYGHGLYFADSEGVARSYRDALSSRDWKLTAKDGSIADGYDVGYDIAEDLVLDYPDAISGKYEAKETYADWAISRMQDGMSREEAAALPLAQENPIYRDAVERLYDKYDNAFIDQGSLYRAHLDVDPDTLLDWDKPLSEQSPAVMEMLKQNEGKINDTLNGLRLEDFLDPEHPTPAQALYDQLSYALGRNPKTGKSSDPQAATNFLQDMGIPGIRYLDAMSRPTNIADKKIWDTWERHGKDTEAAINELMRSYHDTPKAKKEYEKYLRDEFKKGRSSNYVMFSDQPISIQERGNIDPLVLGNLAAAASAAAMFENRRSQKKGRWQGLRQDLMDVVKQVNSSPILNMLKSPIEYMGEQSEAAMQGLYGLNAAINQLRQGEDLFRASQIGAQRAAQPTEDVTREMGGQVVDALSETALKPLAPAVGAAIHTGLQMGAPL